MSRSDMLMFVLFLTLYWWQRFLVIVTSTRGVALVEVLELCSGAHNKSCESVYRSLGSNTLQLLTSQLRVELESDKDFPLHSGYLHLPSGLYLLYCTITVNSYYIIVWVFISKHHKIHRKVTIVEFFLYPRLNVLELIWVTCKCLNLQAPTAWSLNLIITINITNSTLINLSITFLDFNWNRLVRQDNKN